jgi:hypothetical protein
MHERDCSQADSLGLNRARAILVEILAEQGRWSDVLMQIGEIRRAMSTHETLFNNTFGSMIDYAEAQIRAGSVDAGIRTLTSIAATTTNGQPHTATETAIHDALRAVGSGRLGNRNAAVRAFSAALPLLERAAGNGARDARQLC